MCQSRDFVVGLVKGLIRAEEVVRSIPSSSQAPLKVRGPNITQGYSRQSRQLVYSKQLVEAKLT